MNTPILIYHGLSKDHVENRYTLHEREFEKQMQFLHANNFKSILAIDYYRFLKNPTLEKSGRYVMITFDDGHESDYSIALPILKKYGFVACVFVTTDWIGKTGYMNPAQLMALKEEGMLVQSHTKTHRFLNELGSNEIEREIEGSKKKLEDILGEEVSYLAFPGGRYNSEVIYCGKKMNLSGMFSSVPFSLNRFDNTFLIGRYNIKRSVGHRLYFEKFVNANMFSRSAFKGAYYGKNLMKKILGNYLYYLAWKKYIGKP